MKDFFKIKSKVGITCGAFDLLHAGHVVMFEEAKTVCDYLIVALQIDPSTDRPDKNKPLQNIVERQLQLKAVKWIDEIVVYHREHELEDIFYTFPIDIRIIGEEYKDKVFTGINSASASNRLDAASNSALSTSNSLFFSFI